MNWLHATDEGEVRILTLDRPETRNAVPYDGWPELRQAFIEFEESPARVLVITGAGGDFCAGADLADPGRFAGGGGSVAERHHRMKVVGAAATALHRLSKPTIAAVDGVAAGAGMNLALGCDLVLASDRARFSEIFVRRGLTLDFGGSWLLPRIVGLQRAKELALTGRIVGAEEAVRIGIALEVVPHDRLLDRASELAGDLLKGAPIGQMFAKQALDASHHSTFSESLSWEAQSQSIALGTEDALEGVQSFLEKRDPDWRGR